MIDQRLSYILLSVIVCMQCGQFLLSHSCLTPLDLPPPPSNALRIPNIIALHTFGLPVQGTLLPSEFQKATRGIGIGIDIFCNHPVAKSHQCQLYCFVFLVRLTPPLQKKKLLELLKQTCK